MLAISKSAENCCDKLEVFVPSMQKEELEEVVLFLYSGKISQDDKGNVLENLINVFGFPENMNLTDFTQVKQELKVEAEIKKEVVVDDNFDLHEEEAALKNRYHSDKFLSR